MEEWTKKWWQPGGTTQPRETRRARRLHDAGGPRGLTPREARGGRTRPSVEHEKQAKPEINGQTEPQLQRTEQRLRGKAGVGLG